MIKGRGIIKFAKSQPLFDAHGGFDRFTGWAFLIGLQDEISRVRCRISQCFA